MVEDVLTTEDGQVPAKILLTVASCPLKEPLTKDVTSALSRVDGSPACGSSSAS